MLGERSDQRGLWEADRLYLDHVGRDTFYGLLASLRGRLFRDADFVGFYCPDNGRDSVPPSLLATALLLQSHDKVSDAEAKARADFDIRWKVALGIEIEDRPFAKSTLQVFRAQLILHDKVREVFESSLRLARESGYLKKRSMKVALDTTNILGRGGVKDTCNLLADGIIKLLRTLAAVERTSVKEWGKARGYDGYLGSSVKGEAAIDWSDKRDRQALLAGIVRDADRLLELARQAQGELAEDSFERQQIVAAAELLGQLLLQNVERTDDGVNLKDGVSRDRMMSVHDPEMRHGHKNSSRRFDGHKAAIVVDTDSQLITAVDVLPGNAPDNLGSLEMVEQSEANTGVLVEEAMGDAAYGDGDTRQAFADAGRRLVARVPGRPDRKHFPKDDFVIDLAAGSCTCPAGQVTHTIVPAGNRTDRRGRVHRLQAFQFDGAECRTCPLRSQCIAAKGSRGRRVLIHPQEALLQQARALQQSTHYDEYRVRRVVVEHRLARLVQLGTRQSRYFGRVKTRFQLYLAATVANLTLVAGKLGWSGRTGGGATGRSTVLNIVPFVVAHTAANPCEVRLGQLWPVILLTSALLPKSPYPTGLSGPVSRSSSSTSRSGQSEHTAVRSVGGLVWPTASKSCSQTFSASGRLVIGRQSSSVLSSTRYRMRLNTLRWSLKLMPKRASTLPSINPCDNAIIRSSKSGSAKSSTAVFRTTAKRRNSKSEALVTLSLLSSICRSLSTVNNSAKARANNCECVFRLRGRIEVDPENWTGS